MLDAYWVMYNDEAIRLTLMSLGKVIWFFLMLSSDGEPSHSNCFPNEFVLLVMYFFLEIFLKLGFVKELFKVLSMANIM